MLPHPSAQLQPAPGSQRWGLDGTHLWPPQRKVLTPPLSPSADINMLSDPEISAKLFAGCSHPVLAQAQEASVSWSDAILCQGSGMLLLLALWKPKCNSCSALTLLFCLFSLLFCVVQGMMRWPGGAAAIENGLFVAGLSNSSPVLKQMWRYCKTPQKKKINKSFTSGFDVAGSAGRPRSSVALWPSCHIFFVLSAPTEEQQGRINGLQGGLSTQQGVLPCPSICVTQV